MHSERTRTSLALKLLTFFGTLALILVLSLPAGASSCAAFFENDSIETRSFSFEGQTVQYSVAKNVKYTNSVIVSANSVLPKADRDSLVIGFTDDHAFIYFRGHRIDAVGLPGMYVSAAIRKNDSLKAPMFGVLKLNETQAGDLLKIIENEKSLGALTCSQLTCSYVRKIAVDALPKGSFLTPSSLLKELMRLSVSDPQRVKIFALNDVDPKRLLGAQVFRQTARAVSMGVLYTSAAATYVSLIAQTFF